MPFTGSVYAKFKSFANGGAVLPADINGVQDDLGNALGGLIAKAGMARTTTLPTTGLINDMVVPWQPPNALGYGVTWMMKYNAAAPTYKWENVGGMPLISSVAGVGTLSSLNTLASLDGNNVQDLNVIQYTGEWTIEGVVGNAENKDSTTNTYFSVQPGIVGGPGVEAFSTGFFANAWLTQFPNGTSQPGASSESLYMKRSLFIQAGATVGLRYYTTSAAVQVSGKLFSVIPLRVTG
jgi:hypothetical protein